MTKKYKIGDTIYLKGIVKDIDCTDTDIPYGIQLTSNYGTDAWVGEKEIVESPAKPILPKDVADEMSFAKSIKGVTFDDYIVRELIRSDYKDSATNKMIQSPDLPNTIEVLLNAWNNGYTMEKEEEK